MTLRASTNLERRHCRARLAALAAAVALLSAACVTAGDADLYQRLEVTAPDAECSEPVDFNAQVLPIFEATCAKAGCHGKGFESGGLSLESGNAYDELVGVVAQGKDKPRVDPGDEANSYIVDRILARDATLMPPFGDPLPAESIGTIVCWIEQGAEPGTAPVPEPDAGPDAGGGDAGPEPDAGPPPEVCGPDGSVPFVDCVVPILEQHSCNAQFCHGGGAPNPLTLDLDEPKNAFDALVGQRAVGIAICDGDEVPIPYDRVTPGKPDQSYLVDALAGQTELGGVTCDVQRMPLGASKPIPKDQFDMIVRWIEKGAVFDEPSE